MALVVITGLSGLYFVVIGLRGVIKTWRGEN